MSFGGRPGKCECGYIYLIDKDTRGCFACGRSVSSAVFDSTTEAAYRKSRRETKEEPK